MFLELKGMNFVRVKCGMRDMLFLLDTGASISVIFSESVQKTDSVDTSKKIRVKGLGGNIVSTGVVNLSFSIANAKIKHEFYILEFNTDFQGVLGMDFFIQHKANLNYEKFLFSFWNNDCEVLAPIISDFDCYMSIPPRSEIIKYCSSDQTDECVIFPEELCEGVFVAGILAKSENGRVPVRLLNVNDREVKIRNFKPRLERACNFEAYNFGKTNNLSVERIDKVLDLIDTSALNKEEHLAIEKICAKYADVFHLDDDPVTVTNLYKQKLQLKDNAVPVYVKPYRLPHSQKTEINKQVKQMLHDGIIEEAKCEWSSPLLIVPKKADLNGIRKWRIVIDYRLLNKQIIDDKFPLPCISEILDSLSGAIYFSHLDLSQGYYQLELHKNSRKYTAFTTNEGQFQMKRLPMGLKVSPSAFSRLMTVALSGLNYESCFIYLDDLIIFGNSLQQHNRNLVRVLQRLREVNLKLNPSKCDFLKKEILYLGHIISSEGILPDPEKSRSILQFPIPKNADETKRFVAFANYYRKFIRNFAQIAQPLNELSRKGSIFNWSDKCQTSFDTLKQALSNPPILQYPNFSENNTFILKTDASGYAIGAVLSNANDHPIAFASRVLNKAEKNYCTVEKELLAIVWSVQHFRPYLYGRKFEIFTDHRPLVYLFSITNPSSRLTKFRLILEEYDFTISYVKGSDNVVADALSRVRIDSNELMDMCERVNVMTRAQSKRNDIQRNLQQEKMTITEERLDHPGLVEVLNRPVDSVELRPINKNLFIECKNKICGNSAQSNKSKNDDYIYDELTQIIYFNQDYRSTFDLGTSLRELAKICKNCEIKELYIIKNAQSNEFIKHLSRYKQDIINTGIIKISIIQGVKRIENKEVQQLILNDFHNLPTGGHSGTNRMYNNIKKYYHWSRLKKDIEEFVKKCDDCQRCKYGRVNKQPITITTTATSAFQKIYLDLVGPIKNDIDENSYILTIQCELSKFIECYPLLSKEADIVSKSFVENFILRYGIPREVVTDQGKEFIANVFQESCKLLGIKTLNSTAHHHETLGALENSHKHLGAYLRIQVSKYTRNWSTWLPYWCFAFNNTVHTETKHTPYELVFGKLNQIPLSISDNIDPLYNFGNYSKELKYRIQNACHDARNNLLVSKQKRKETLDEKRNEIFYKSGDKVLIFNESRNAKMDPLYTGPYEVVRDENPNVILKINNKDIKVHKNRIKLYYT